MTAEGLRRTIADALGVASDRISTESSADNVDEWDSLGHLQVVLAVEKRFGVRFRTDELPHPASVAALANRLRLS